MPADALPRRLVETTGQFAQAFDRWLQRCQPVGGLSWSRLRLLGILSCHGPQMMSDLGDALGVTPRTVAALFPALSEPDQRELLRLLQLLLASPALT